MTVDPKDKTPIYKQLVEYFEHGARDGSLEPGTMLPSMNELAAEYGISRETAKKAYGILVKSGVIVPHHGKGFYIARHRGDEKLRILLILDELSIYKQIMFKSFSDTLAGKADITIVNHGQDPQLLQYYLDQNLDEFDYYLIAPHFSLDDETTAFVHKQLDRVPNRKLIMLDRFIDIGRGSYGSVYQDFENDIYDGLSQGADPVGAKRAKRLRVLTLPTSLYGPMICRGVEKFAADHGKLKVEFLSEVPDDIIPGDCFLVLNSKLDSGLVALAGRMKVKGFIPGKDVFIVSYNEYDINELVLGGLTTVSTDFPAMGRIAAGMILSGKLEKVHSPFRMTKRSTF